MNLTNLFNIKYLKQNLKKSSSVLLIFTLLIPILNTLILISRSTKTPIIPSFAEISLLNIIGIYILPMIIAICLFNYIFKKQSVDFVSSMPIKRSSIYISNLIGGLLLILSMLIINTILIFLVTLIFDVHIPLIMLLDYIKIWFISYTFSLTASILAVSISGNAITSIVVTLLLMFFIPFTNTYINILKESSSETNYLIKIEDDTITKNYICSNNQCETNKEKNLYNIDMNNKNYHISKIANFFLGYQDEDDEKTVLLYSNITMIILSIIYTLTGYITFTKRKMENCETSFKNIHAHNIIKGLTFLPFMAVAYLILRETTSIVSYVFVFVLLLIYSLIYDLITKKNITNIKISTFYFILFIALYITFFSLNDTDTKYEEIIDYNDINTISIDLNSLPNHTNQNQLLNTKQAYINDSKLKELIIKNAITTNKEDYTNNITAYLNINNKIYELNLFVNDDYNQILSILQNNNTYKNTHKSIEYHKIYAIQIAEEVYTPKQQQQLLSLIETTLNNMTLKDYIDLTAKYNRYTEDDYTIKLYTYKNHDKYQININPYINYNLLNYVVNQNNTILKQNMNNIHKETYTIFYQNKYFKDNYTINYTCLAESKKELYNFITNELNNIVDMKKEYITLELCEEGHCYNFTTNNITKFKDILDTKYNELLANGYFIETELQIETDTLIDTQQTKEQHEY